MSFQRELEKGAEKASKAVNSLAAIALAIGALSPHVQVLAEAIPQVAQVVLLLGGGIFGTFSKPVLDIVGIFKRKQ